MVVEQLCLELHCLLQLLISDADKPQVARPITVHHSGSAGTLHISDGWYACLLCVCVCSVTSYINSAIHHSVITVLIYRLFTLFTMSSLAVTLTLLDGRYDDADDVMWLGVDARITVKDFERQRASHADSQVCVRVCTVHCATCTMYVC